MRIPAKPAAANAANQTASDEFRPVGSGEIAMCIDTTAIPIKVRVARCFNGTLGLESAANIPYEKLMTGTASGRYEACGSTTQSRRVPSARSVARIFMPWPNA